MKELLKKAFDAGMNRQWSIDYQENVKTRPSFEEWYKEHENEVLALHNVVGQSEHVKCECGYNGQMEQNQLYDAVRCPNCQTVYANI